MFVGIDFGAKTAGSTVICRRERGLFHFDRCAKGQDGDEWLEEWVVQHAPRAIYIDAPLSLPAAYFGKGHDYIFRQADRVVGGMSPMFLGGLTARAMRCAAHWRELGIHVHEVYPAALVRREWDFLKIPHGRAIPPHKLRLMAGMCMVPPPDPSDRHEADAWLCWLIGHRHQQGVASAHGQRSEGVILA